jgi:hypothetical protein
VPRAAEVPRMIRAREEGCGSGVDLVVDGICEGKGVRDPTNACAFINAFFAVSIVCSRPNKNKKVYSSPLKTPSRAVCMCSGDGGTRRGRGGDTDRGPSEPLIVIERGG